MFSYKEPQSSIGDYLGPYSTSTSPGPTQLLDRATLGFRASGTSPWVPLYSYTVLGGSW